MRQTVIPHLDRPEAQRLCPWSSGAVHKCTPPELRCRSRSVRIKNRLYVKHEKPQHTESKIMKIKISIKRWRKVYLIFR